MKSTICITASLLVAVFAISIPMGAQEAPSERRYRLIDLGTLGGPNSYLPLPAPYHDGPLPLASISRGGTFAGFADTNTPDPYAPICFWDCYVAHAIAWRHGAVKDLGALPYAPGLSSAATWISNNGLIAGLSENGLVDPLINIPAAVAVLWDKGKITNLGTLEGGYESQATAVNSAGQVAGFSTNLVPDPNSLLGTTTQSRAFVWQHGVMHDLGTLPGGTDAMALFINERGQVVGQSYSADSIVPPANGTCVDSPLTLFGFFWDQGHMKNIGTLGGHCTFPYALNNQGQVVGQSSLAGDTTSHPFLWRPGQKMRDLGALGGNYGFAEWLNDEGMIVGSATNSGDQALLAFEWHEETMTNLGALEGNACSAADAINSTGLVVGGSGFNTASFPACTDAVEHAVMWDHGQIVDLNAFVPPGSDITLSEAFFVNDDGEIAGVGTISSGDQHTFVLLPCRDSDDECHDAVGYATYRLGPQITKRPNNPNALDRIFRHGLGPVSRPEGALDIRDVQITDEAPAKARSQTLDSAESLDTDLRFRFAKAPACILPGRPCSLNQSLCCFGRKCVFHGGSTRVGYMCE